METRFVISIMIISIQRKERTWSSLHGIGASAERWSNVIPFLSKHFRIIVPDIIGFGYSDKPTVEYNMPFFVKFLEDFLNSLGVKKASIGGSSFEDWLQQSLQSRIPTW